ncbi:hypothetical protein [Dechloromonas denitrificans]|uniref:DUF7673 family protein n=1 Tax=Dechloromonas denitrificans TaxID=281362 RepID=UPI001CF8C581|nr:hypothetical protein [Dechloromonas denitrificans]UCV02330.1 hypothetical protein KI611_14690 [Dechloromonas denitrificans]
MSDNIKIIPLEDKPSDDRMITLEVTVQRSEYPKLLAFMQSETWEKAEAARNANLTDCLKSMEIALNWALKHDTSGARVFATLLASMYNGNRVKFDVSDLKCLDAANFEHALNCMRLCQELHREPHQFFENGGELFERLIKDWKLEKKARAAR